MNLVHERSDLDIGIRIPFYYGYGRRAWDKCVDYYYVIPINFAVRFWERVKRIYFSLMANSRLRSYEHGIRMRGYQEGYDACRGRLDYMIDQAVKGIKNESP